MDPKSIIDYCRFPLEHPQHPAYTLAIKQVRASLDHDGCAVLPNFLSPQGLLRLQTEAKERLDRAYYAPKKHCNIYLGKGNSELPEDHPQNTFMERSNGFITADLLGPGTASHTLYYWPPLRDFLARCLNKPTLFNYADPVSNMIVNVAHKGQQFNWHYDTNEFTITFLLQAALVGGQFEYVPNLRSPADECIEQVKQVLAGDRSRVKRLTLNQGDLQFFLGRYALHQVTANQGDSERLLLIQSFCENEGITGNPYRVKDLYGKTTAVHQQARSINDGLMD